MPASLRQRVAETTNVVAQPGSGFSVTNMVVSGSAQGSLVFSLGSAPGGLTVNATNGLLSWVPDCSQGNTTNLVTVWVTDSARPNIADAISFLVSVEECVEPSLGQVIVLAGESGQIPLNLISTANLTNLQATLVATPGRLLNFSIQPLVSNVCVASVTPLSNDWQRLSLSMCSNGYLAGTQQVAWLNFTAADLASAFVPLTLTNLIGFESNGVTVANFAPQSGRVVVLSDEPLMEMIRNTNGQPLLYLYGVTAPGYRIETRANLASCNWQTIISNLVMTNLVQPIIPAAVVNSSSFFRAQRVDSITPARLRSAELVQQTNVTFVVRGLAFRNYGVQMSSGLQSTNWQNIGTVICDRDGIARFTNAVPASATERYFRTVVPQ